MRSGTHTLLSPNAPIDPARTAIGQANLVVTPMQMAMVAAAFANGGVVMRPTLVDRVRSPERRAALRSATASRSSRAFSEQTAAAVTEMMKHVVDEGTGTAAQIPGVQIAGKTGTAQTGRNGQLDAWFIAFAPAESPQVAVAVVVERTRAVRRPGGRADRARRHAGGAECRFVSADAAPLRAGRARSSCRGRMTAMTGEDTERGQPFDGRYRVLGRLGVGGMATVYLAEDSSLGRKVALKVMAERYAEDGEFVERFRREAQAAARLNHPNIIAVYDRGEADGRPYIAMEYLQGRTLKQVIQKDGPLPPERAIAVAMQVLAGLRYAHEHGVVHRDVKPHNVLVGDDGRIKVTDFGIAHAGDPQMTEVGSIVGTAQYLSPEQARGRSVGPQTDIYSLGVVLYEMLAGRVPFEGDSSVAIAMQHVSDEPPPLRSLAPLTCPSRSAMVVAHAMLKEPAQRYGSADEFAADLDRVRRGLVPVAATALIAIVPHEPTEQVPAAEATRIAPRAEATPLLSGEKLPPRPTPRKRSRWPWLLVLLLLLAVGALAAFALGVGSGDDYADDDGDDRRRRPRRRPPVTSRKLDDLEGKSFLEAHRRSTATGSSSTSRRQRVRDATHEADVVVASDPDRRRGAAPAATRSCSRSRAGRRRSRTSSDKPRRPTRSGSSAPTSSPQQTSEASDSTDKGKVTRTDPAVGQTIPVGSNVTLWVSTGPARCRCRTSWARPRTRRAPRSASAGLIVNEPPGSRCSDDVEVGQVAKQGARRRHARAKGTARCSFDLANSPCTVDVPNVRTLPRRRRRSQLLQAKSIAAGNIKSSHQTVTRAEPGRHRARPGHRGHERQAVRGHAHGGPARSTVHDAATTTP